LDHALADGDSTELCARLTARGIPYVSYSGFDPVKGADSDAPFVGKPAKMDTLLAALKKLLITRAAADRGKIIETNSNHGSKVDPASGTH
jgi:hypothetical protein